MLVLGGWILTTITVHTGQGELLWITGVLGLGAGLTVSPGLFMAALSVKPALVGRALALAELLRACSAFLTGPILLYVLQTGGSGPAALTGSAHDTAWAALALAALGFALYLGIFVTGRAHLHPPRLEQYLQEGEEALESPPVTAAQAS